MNIIIDDLAIYIIIYVDKKQVEPNTKLRKK